MSAKVIAEFVSRKSVQAPVLALVLGACSGVIGIDGPSVSARTLKGTQKHRILVASTRQQSDDPAIMFSGRRGGLSFAQVEVYVPPIHK